MSTEIIETQIKAATAEIIGKVQEQKSDLTKMQAQLDAVDISMQRLRASGGGGGGADVDASAGLTMLKKSITEHRDSLQRNGRVSFEIPTLLPEGKSTIVSTGLTSSEPSTGVQGAGRFPYRLRQLFRSVPTSLPTIGVLRTTSETLVPSPQVEATPKSESTMAFTLVQVPIQTLASFITFSKQALDDIDGFGTFLNATLVWALEKKAELEILSGDGTGVHLPGLIPGAVAFDSTILSATLGYNRVDVLGAAAVQLREAGYAPTFAVVSPRNWFRMISQRGSDGQYSLNNPRTAVGESVYDLIILPTPSITGDSFLVGDASQAVIRQREETTVSLSYEHGTNYTSNLVTALAEQRFGLQTLRPDAFVTGTLASSPA